MFRHSVVSSFSRIKQSKKNDCLTLEDVTDMLPQIVCKQLPTYTEQYARKTEALRKQRLDTFCPIDLHMTMLGGGGGRGGGEVEVIFYTILK
jgi:hypothetical protein